MLETSDPAGGCSTEEDERNISGDILKTFSRIKAGVYIFKHSWSSGGIRHQMASFSSFFHTFTQTFFFHNSTINP